MKKEWLFNFKVKWVTIDQNKNVFKKKNSDGMNNKFYVSRWWYDMVVVETSNRDAKLSKYYQNCGERNWRSKIR